MDITSEHYFTAFDGASAVSPVGVPEALASLTLCVLIMQDGSFVVGASTDGEKSAWHDAAGKLQHGGPRYRCAISGEYVTPGYAEANPDTTVKES